MTNKIYTQTGIVENSWNSRGLITHNFVNKTLIKTDTGILFAAVQENLPTNEINIYVSLNNGFSWLRKLNATLAPSFTDNLTGSDSNGPIMHLIVNELTQTILLSVSGYSFGSSLFRVITFGWNYVLGEDSITFIPWTDAARFDTDGSVVTVNTMDSLNYDVSTTDNLIYFTLIFDGKIFVKAYYLNVFSSPVIDSIETLEDDYSVLISTYTDSQTSTLDILAIRNLGLNYELVYLKFDSITQTFDSPIVISLFPAAVANDLNISRDGYNNLLAYWSQFNQEGTFINEYYSISYNNGLTWSTPTTIPTTASQGDFEDSIILQKAGRTVSLNGDTGFILSYVRNFNGKAITYIRTLLSENGTSYELSEEKIAASHATKDVVGLRFFKTPGNELYNFDQIGDIRFAYQIGQGNSPIQDDRTPVYFGQKLLLNEAFLELEIIAFEEDTPLQYELLVNFNLLGSLDDNLDYYTEGLVGNITDKYISAFDRFGTSIQLIQYEPIQSSKINDKNAYRFETSVYVKAFVDSISYANPFSGNEVFTSYIERDTRQIHLPPDMHISRNYILNDGNKQKRTVWLMKYAGNDYEITQVVPYFIDNQIAYYTANAFVVGATRNPFTRNIQPTET
jgi:hypothetical protein